MLWRTDGGGREWKREVTEIIQVRDDSCLDRGVAGGSAKLWTESGYILKVEPTKFPSGLDVKCEQKREVKNASEHTIVKQLYSNKDVKKIN